MLLSKIKTVIGRLRAMADDMEAMRLAIGRLENQLADKSHMQVYSQFNEDGIIQLLLQHIPCENNCFIEFGVEDYTQSNTRFLLQNNNWSGIVIDGDTENIKKIHASKLHTFYELDAYHLFITRENINAFLLEKLDGRQCDLLSIDIDGNDYWVWEAITSISPSIVIIEYNSLFGSSNDCTIEYEPGFIRSERTLFKYGASYQSLLRLAKQKGYSFVRCNSNGNNMFFVKQSLSCLLPEYVFAPRMIPQTFREFREPEKRQRYNSFDKRRKLLDDYEFHKFEE